MNDYKSDIISSRVGCLGGSDGHFLRQVAELGVVPRSMYKRLAVLKGLVGAGDDVTTRAMRYGDLIEQRIFASLSSGSDGWQSNPLWESVRYSGRNFRLICHPDFVYVDESSKEIRCYECKCTKYDYYATRSKYMAQLYIEWVMAKEQARKRGSGWKSSLYLVHYATADMDLSVCGDDFDAGRITVRKVNVNSDESFDLGYAVKVVDDFLDGFDFYTEADEVDASLLPADVQRQFAVVSGYLRDIKEKEAEIDLFKRRVYEYFTSHGIAKVKCEDFSFTVVPDGVSRQFDAKSFMEDYARAHPLKARALRKKYGKEVKRRGYVKITVSKDE